MMTGAERAAAIREQLVVIATALDNLQTLMKHSPRKGLLDEEGAPTPKQFRARVERDSKRQQRINRINQDASQRVADIRADIGK